jgi:hypothetical protein
VVTAVRRIFANGVIAPKSWDWVEMLIAEYAFEAWRRRVVSFVG